VDNAGPFARAGLRAGDVLAALDGTEVRDPEAFRRLLRRRVAEGGLAQLRVLRDGKTTDVRVLLP
jgi:S1-C subfamily serine protease